MRRAVYLSMVIALAAACSTFGDEVVTPTDGDAGTTPDDDAGATTDGGSTVDGPAAQDGADSDAGVPTCDGERLLGSEFDKIPDPSPDWASDEATANSLNVDSAFRSSGVASVKAGPVSTGRGRFLGRKVLDAGVPKAFCLSFDLATQHSAPADAGGYVEALQVDVFPVPAGGPRVYLGIGVNAKGRFLHIIGAGGEDTNIEFDLGTAKTFHRWTFLVRPNSVAVWVDGDALTSTTFGTPVIGQVAISVGANGMNASSPVNRPSLTSWIDNLKATLQ